jgi:hypothetical protein
VLSPAVLTASSAPIDAALRIASTPIAFVTSNVWNRGIELSDGAMSWALGNVWETTKAGFVDQYGLDPEHTQAKMQMRAAIRSNARKTGEIIDKLRALNAAQSRIAYLWASTKDEDGIDVAAERALFATLPEEQQAVMRSLRDEIVHLGAEAVRLKLLSQEVYDRNKFAYMRRSYQRYVLDDTNAQARRQRAISIIGDEFMMRGMRDNAGMAQIGTSDWWQRKTNGTAHDPSLKGQKFHRLERRSLPDSSTPQLFEDEDGTPLGAIRELVYWPVDEAIPAKYADWRNDGEWEARWFDVPGKVGMHRDFTLQERTRMGEIQEVKWAAATTMLQMVRDVEAARFLDWVAHNEAKVSEDQLPEGHELVKAHDGGLGLIRAYRKNEWVQVPDTEIRGTGLKRYGALAGRFVPGPVWNDIRQISELSSNDEITRALNAGLRLWKISKTALSFISHVNNVMSNLMLADLHDIQARHVLTAMRAWMSWAAGKNDPMLRKLIEDYQDNGGDGGKFNEAEVKRELYEPLLEQLRQDIEEAAGGVSANITAMQAMNLMLHGQFRHAFAALGDSKAAKLPAWAVAKLIKLYGVEDELFRLAAFIKAREDGLSDVAAGRFARESFVNYEITAPWINVMRRTLWPFLAFQYRTAPMIAKGFAEKPHKLVKWWAFGGVLNTMAYGMGSAASYFTLGLMGGDDDDAKRERRERALMPPEKKGRLIGILGPKMVRIPDWLGGRDRHGSPIFLDVRNWVPTSNIADTGRDAGAFWIPPPLIPGGPLMLPLELIPFNESGYNHKEIVNGVIDDTALKVAGKVADWAWKAVMPNNPLVPGTYSQEGVIDAMRGRRTVGGDHSETTSVGMAFASSMGIKLHAYPIDVMADNLKAKAAAERKIIIKDARAKDRANNYSGLEETDPKRIAQHEKIMKEATGNLARRNEEFRKAKEEAGLQ